MPFCACVKSHELIDQLYLLPGLDLDEVILNDTTYKETPQRGTKQVKFLLSLHNL